MAQTQHSKPPKRIRDLEREAEFWQHQHDVLLQIFPDALFVHDADGKLVSVNAEAERLSGCSKDQLLGMNFRDLLKADSWERLQALLGQPKFSTGAEMVTAGRGVLAVELRGSVQNDLDGAVRVLYIVRETATNKTAEEALRHSESRFRLMAKNLTEMVLAYDMDRRLTFSNPAAQTLTGYTPSELEHAQFICWIHPEDRERMLAHWDQLFEGKTFYEEEYRLVTKDGRLKWVAATWGPILDDQGRQVGVQGRERDVTERRTAEETLRQSEQSLRVNEERYRALFENSPFPMWEEDFSGVKAYLGDLVARGGTNLRAYLTEHRDAVEECVRRVKVLDINRAAREFYGAEENRQLIENLPKIFDDRAYEIFIEEMAVLAENNSIYQAEFPVRTLRGDERTVNMIVSLTPSPNNDWSRVIVSFFDTTDRRKLEEQLLQSQKLESLGRLAGGIAHDFNNLLMVISGYSDLLLGALNKPDDLRHGLLEIRNASKRGADLTQQLLAFSRKQVSQPRAMSINEVIQDSKSMFQRLIGEDIRLKISLDPAAWTIKADRGQIHQVLMNLVVNSREAMPSSGVLTIETKNVQLGNDLQEEPQNTSTRPFLRLKIRDTGAGMDEVTRQHVFDPFFSTKGTKKGTGLGLATVFGIVTQSGGHIFVESEPGHGTTFNLYFPRLDAPSPDTSAEPARKSPGQGTRKSKATGVVLVVEDQDDVRQLTSAILRGLGFEVLEAGDGMEASLVSAQHKGPIRLMVTDVIMPGINGRELAEQLAPSRPEMLVIYMSGYTDRIMSPDGVLDSSVAFLQKPFTPEMLTDMVERILNLGD